MKKPTPTQRAETIVSTQHVQTAPAPAAKAKPIVTAKTTVKPTIKPTAIVTIKPKNTTTPTPRVSLAEIKKYTPLSFGMASTDVLRLKERLQVLGYIGPSMLNNKYTDHTTDAVKAFQKRNAVPATGIADPQTQALLFSQAALTASEGIEESVSVTQTQSKAQKSSSKSSMTGLSGTSSFKFSNTEGPKRTPQPSAPDEYVWIPRTGARYHRRSNCSRMKNPSQVLRSEAIRRGYTPCKVCKPK